MPDVGLGPLAWQVAASMGVVLVLGVACILAIKKLFPRITRLRGRNISLLETISLGPHKTVHLLKVGERKILVAGAKDRVTMLADVTEALTQDPTVPTARAFGQVLAQAEKEVPAHDVEN